MTVAPTGQIAAVNRGTFHAGLAAPHSTGMVREAMLVSSGLGTPSSPEPARFPSLFLRGQSHDLSKEYCTSSQVPERWPSRWRHLRRAYDWFTVNQCRRVWRAPGICLRGAHKAGLVLRVSAEQEAVAESPMDKERLKVKHRTAEGTTKQAGRWLFIGPALLRFTSYASLEDKRGAYS